jgi:hypothetical protein
VRVFGIAAAGADVVAVLWRGPSGWCHVGRWDIAARRYQPGSWQHGTLYPQRCDLSADGRYLCYFAFKGNSTRELGDIYIAVSRLPWLTALAAWRTPGTWTRGAHFTTAPVRGSWSAAATPPTGACRSTTAPVRAARRTRRSGPEHLGEVQWADWARNGELLTATADGRLQIRDRVNLQVAWEHDLAPMRPHGGEPPEEARHWHADDVG